MILLDFYPTNVILLFHYLIQGLTLHLFPFGIL
jgi:hypothetical protein